MSDELTIGAPAVPELEPARATRATSPASFVQRLRALEGPPLPPVPPEPTDRAVVCFTALASTPGTLSIAALVVAGNLFEAPALRSGARPTAMTPRAHAQLRVEHGDAGPARATIELTPPLLGALELDLVVRGNAVSITARVASERAGAALRAAEPGLRACLQEAGFELPPIEIRPRAARLGRRDHPAQERE